jgi:hypothetical protein
VERNEKRMIAATGGTNWKPGKGYSRVWSKDEVETMLGLERTLWGHPQIAKQMMEHLPGKTTKQISDKRRETSYKALVEGLDIQDGQLGTVDENTKPESDLCQAIPDLCAAPAEDRGMTKQGEVTGNGTLR